MSDLHDLHTPEQIHTAFREFLRKRGIKYTTARRKILDAVLDLHEHFEAEQVLYLLRDRGEKVGKATVYRTLPLLVECGVLKQVRFEVKQAHYEHAFGQGPHDHMVCRRCGRIIEFGAEEVLELRQRIGRRHHFHVTGHRFQLTGLCWECSTACPVATMAAKPVNRDSDRS
ncbi:MAG: transcriptional repressor [Phycisphaerae bacterium]|nr:transcriptional repressor [Phycisphaerae bacterium]